MKVVLTASTALSYPLLCLYALRNSHTDQDSTAHKLFSYAMEKLQCVHQPVFIHKTIAWKNCSKNAAFSKVYLPKLFNFTQRAVPPVLPPLHTQCLDISKDYNCFRRASETSRCLETSPVLCSGSAGTPLRGSLG